MAQLKVLNLDVLSKEKQRSVLTLHGKEYEVLDSTVEDFIETSVAAKQLEDSKAGAVEQINATIDMIKRRIPTIDVAALRSLTFEQLHMIIKFIQGEMEEGAAPDAEVVDGEADAKKE